MRTAVIVSGYFNPLHKGHLELFRKAKDHADRLVVIVNSDEQRELKGSKEFMNQEERATIVDNIGLVDYTLVSIDKDKTQIETLKYLNKIMSKEFKLYFANGGDQTNKTIPEAKICKKLKITLIDGLGDKIQSSSWLLGEK